MLANYLPCLEDQPTARLPFLNPDNRVENKLSRLLQLAEIGVMLKLFSARKSCGASTLNR
jgi:hypothetical protein